VNTEIRLDSAGPASALGWFQRNADPLLFEPPGFCHDLCKSKFVLQVWR
jgi:hypothetical protein